MNWRAFLLTILISTTASAEVPNYVQRSLDKQIVREQGRTYTVGPGRYVHKIPREKSGRTRCQPDRHMSEKDHRVIDCRDNQQ